MTNIKEKMTSKTTHKVGLISALSAVIAFAVIVGTISLEIPEIASEPETVGTPADVRFYQGVPMLRLGEVIGDKTKYNQVSTGQYDWLDRVIKQGETIVSDKEVEEFFEVRNGNPYFRVDSEMYFISYSDAKIRLDTNYIKAYPYDLPKLDSKTLNVSEYSWLEKAINNPYEWIEISTDEYNTFKNFERTGTDVRTEKGDYSIRYVGENSKELQLDDNADLVAKSTGEFVQ